MIGPFMAIDSCRRTRPTEPRCSTRSRHFLRAFSPATNGEKARRKWRERVEHRGSVGLVRRHESIAMNGPIIVKRLTYPSVSYVTHLPRLVLDAPAQGAG